MKVEIKLIPPDYPEEYDRYGGLMIEVRNVPASPGDKTVIEVTHESGDVTRLLPGTAGSFDPPVVIANAKAPE